MPENREAGPGIIGAGVVEMQDAAVAQLKISFLHHPLSLTRPRGRGTRARRWAGHPRPSVARPRRSTQFMSLTLTKTISTYPQLRQRTTVPGARRQTTHSATGPAAPQGPHMP